MTLPHGCSSLAGDVSSQLALRQTTAASLSLPLDDLTYQGCSASSTVNTAITARDRDRGRDRDGLGWEQQAVSAVTASLGVVVPLVQISSSGPGPLNVSEVFGSFQQSIRQAVSSGNFTKLLTTYSQAVNATATSKAIVTGHTVIIKFLMDS